MTILDTKIKNYNLIINIDHELIQLSWLWDDIKYNWYDITLFDFTADWSNYLSTVFEMSIAFLGLHIDIDINNFDYDNLDGAKNAD